MRAQFFLDSRDYVKYSLLEDAMQLSVLQQLSIVWMLTPDVPNGHGRRRPHVISTRPELNVFFERSHEIGIPDVADYFRDRGYACNSYGDRPPHYLSAKARDNYFAGIPDFALERALVFLDPDNGIEPRSTVTTAHVRLSELRDLLHRMEESLLVIYQHKPRVKAETFWPQLARRVAKALPTSVAWLPCGDMGFLFLGPKEGLTDLAPRLSAVGDMQHLH